MKDLMIGAIHPEIATSQGIVWVVWKKKKKMMIILLVDLLSFQGHHLHGYRYEVERVGRRTRHMNPDKWPSRIEIDVFVQYY